MNISNVPEIFWEYFCNTTGTADNDLGFPTIPTKFRQILGEIQIQIFTTCQQKQYVSADARKKKYQSPENSPKCCVIIL